MVILEESLRREIRERGVVLMNRSYENMLGIGPSRLAQRFAPAVVGIVSYFTPIDGDQNDGTGESPSPQDESDGLEPVIDCPCRRYSTPHAGVAERRRNVGGKGIQSPRAKAPVGLP
jgi:hypothetical protein